MREVEKMVIKRRERKGVRIDSVRSTKGTEEVFRN